MTFRLKDVQPKTGPVINIKPYNGMVSKYRRSDVRRIKTQANAIEAMKRYINRP